MKEMEPQKTQSTVTTNGLPQKTPKKEVKIVAEIHKQPNLEIAESKIESIDETQCSESGSIQNIEEIMTTEKETFEVNKSQETSSHGTLQYIQPRIRFVERANEIAQSKPIAKQRNEYRTLPYLDEDKDLTTENIYPRDVREQDITECKIEKYEVIGCKMPKTLEENTCKEDDF